MCWNAAGVARSLLLVGDHGDHTGAAAGIKTASGALRALLRGHRETVFKVAFTPDGTAVVSSSFDGTIKFWDSQTGDCLNTVRIAGPYADMNITGVKGITEAQKGALKALGAVTA